MLINKVLIKLNETHFMDWEITKDIQDSFSAKLNQLDKMRVDQGLNKTYKSFRTSYINRKIDRGLQRKNDD